MTKLFLHDVDDNNRRHQLHDLGVYLTRAETLTVAQAKSLLKKNSVSQIIQCLNTKLASDRAAESLSAPQQSKPAAKLHPNVISAIKRNLAVLSGVVAKQQMRARGVALIKVVVLAVFFSPLSLFYSLPRYRKLVHQQQSDTQQLNECQQSIEKMLAAPSHQSERQQTKQSRIARDTRPSSVEATQHHRKFADNSREASKIDALAELEIPRERLTNELQVLRKTINDTLVPLKITCDLTSAWRSYYANPSRYLMPLQFDYHVERAQKFCDPTKQEPLNHAIQLMTQMNQKIKENESLIRDMEKQRILQEEQRRKDEEEQAEEREQRFGFLLF